MFITAGERSYLRVVFELILLALVVFALGSLLTNARQKKSAPKPVPAAARPAEDTPPEAAEPLMREYKGVRLGMTAEEARHKLGEPADKGDRQDFYLFSETESAQVFYDASHQVMAISVQYAGGGASAPTPKNVLGADVEPRPDGSVHRCVNYRRAGCWVSYSRTAGEHPLVTVSVQKDGP